MPFPHWPRSDKEKQSEAFSEEFFELVGNKDRETTIAAVNEFKRLIEDMPASSRSLQAGTREMVIPLSSHAQKEEILNTLYDLNIFPWEESGQLIIDHHRDLAKLRSAGFVEKGLETVSVRVPREEAMGGADGAARFPAVYPQTLSEQLKDTSATFSEKKKEQVRERSESKSERLEPGVDTEIADLVDKFDQGIVDSDDEEFRTTIGFLPSLRLFPQKYVWEGRVLREKRSGKEISNEEQAELLVKAQEGDAASITTLVQINTGLVLKVVTRFHKLRGGDMDDMFQEGMIGLLDAIATQDSEKGKFSTHAMIHIEERVRLFLSEKRSTIRVPAYVGQKASELVRAKKNVAIDGELRPEDVFAEIPDHRMKSGMSSETKIPVNGVGLDRLERLYLLNAAFDPLSDDEDNVLDRENVPHGVLEEPSMDMERGVLKRDMERIISAKLLTLTPREERTIRSRFGISGIDEQTFQEIGDDYGSSPERIRQIEAKALRKLKHPSRSRALRWLTEYPDNKSLPSNW
ncbi:MAG: rpoD [Parcubacteria group bacterium]|nr:rpoD [Parcubacteria group bacterium]